MFRHRSFLIVYASKLGHTRRIAVWIARELERAGPAAEVVEVGGDLPRDVREYSIVIAVSSVHFDRPSRPMVRWLEKHRSALQRVPYEIVSVSLTAAAETTEARHVVERYSRPLAAAAGTEPVLCEHVAGALQYTRYNVFTKTMVRRVARDRGLPTDVRSDVDLTDWAQLQRFAARSIELVDALPVTVGVGR
ncbi:MAG: flavodoxin domain-containing protein [Solirubrobacteraceae bacterium]|nr:flavodoxin domain-containing protein [Solirubrobacteraceae bacterium]